VLLVLALWQAFASLRGPAGAPMSYSGDGAGGSRAQGALALSFLAIVLFLTLVHIVLAVDDRFTTPALPLVGLFAGARVAKLAAARRYQTRESSATSLA